MVKKYYITLKDEKWKLGGLKRKKIETLISHLERKITKDLASNLEQKIAVVVKYDKDTSNETLNTRNLKETMYATVCFLEDYLSKKSLSNLTKKYA